MNIDQLLAEIKSNKKTPDQLLQEIQEINEGRKYGRKGKDADEDAIVERVLSIVISKIPAPIKGEDGKDAVVDYDKIIKSVIKSIPKPKNGKDGKDAKIDYTTIFNKVKEEVSKIQIPEIDYERAAFETAGLFASGEIKLTSDSIYGLNDIIKKSEKQNIKFTQKKIEALRKEMPKLPTEYAQGSGQTFLKSMRDVDVSNVVDGDLLTYNVNKKKWETASRQAIEDVNWGEIGGSITDQTDLTTYIADQLATQDTLQEVTDNGATTTNAITISNDLTVDTDTFHVDSTNNRVGIGTNSPLKTFTIVGSGFDPRVLIDTPDTVSFPGLEFRHNGNNTLRALIRSDYEAGSPNLTFFTSNAGTIEERMRIEGNGNVGIGTDSPDDLLHINNGNNEGVLLENGGRYGIKRNSGGTVVDVLSIPLGSDSLITRFGTSNSNTIGYQFRNSSNQNVFTVMGGGNVGIGTTNPQSALDVKGKVYVSNGTELNSADTEIGRYAFWSDDSSTGASIEAGSIRAITTDAWGSTSISNSARLGFFPVNQRNSSVERMTILPDGNVGIGTTTPDRLLTIEGTGGSGERGLRIISTGTGTADYSEVAMQADAREFRFGVGGSGTNIGLDNKFYFYDLTAAASRMVIDTAGNVGINTTSPAQKLEVNGNILATSFITSGGTSSQFVKGDGSLDSSDYLLESEFIPAGSDTQIQFNNAGAFGASANVTYDGSTFDVTGAEVDLSGTGVANATLSINESGSDINAFTTTIFDWTYQITAYKIVNGVKVYYDQVQTNTARNIGDGTPFSVNVSWDALAGADGYIVQQSAVRVSGGTVFSGYVSGARFGWYDNGTSLTYSPTNPLVDQITGWIDNIQEPAEALLDASNQTYKETAIESIGDINIASGSALTFAGQNTMYRLSDGSISIGGGNVGDTSIDFQVGRTSADNYAQGDFAFTFGYDNKVTGAGVAIGLENDITGASTISAFNFPSIGIGSGNTTVSDSEVAIGFNNTTTDGSVVIGKDSETTSNDSIIIGSNLVTPVQGIFIGSGGSSTSSPPSIIGIDSTQKYFSTFVNKPSWGIELNQDTVIENIVDDRGTNIVTSPNLDVDGDWVKTAGWTQGFNFIEHTSGGGTTTVTPTTSPTYIVGRRYVMYFQTTDGDVSGSHNGSVSVSAGGVSLGSFSSVGRYWLSFTATSTTGLTFTPTNDYDGALFAVYIYPIEGGDLNVLGETYIGVNTVSPDTTLLSEGGATFNENQNDSDFSVSSQNVADALFVDASADTVKVNTQFAQNTTSLSAVGPTDDIDVSNANIVFIDASSNNVTIGGLTGGVNGQVIQLVVNGVGVGNTVTVEHNEGTANQNIFLDSGTDDTLTNKYGGWMLVCDGSNWYESAVH